MTPAADYIAAPFRELPPLGWRQILDARREVDAELRKEQLGLAWHLEWGPASDMVRAGGNARGGLRRGLDPRAGDRGRRGVRFPASARGRADRPPGDRRRCRGAQGASRRGLGAWPPAPRPPLSAGVHLRQRRLRRHDPPDRDPGAAPEALPPLPRATRPGAEPSRVRKHRQRQWVLARFECLNADGELREHTIVDLDLKCERPPDDDAGRWLTSGLLGGSSARRDRPSGGRSPRSRRRDGGRRPLAAPAAWRGAEPLNEQGPRLTTGASITKGTGDWNPRTA